MCLWFSGGGGGGGGPDTLSPPLDPRMVALGRYSLHGYYTLDTATIATEKGTLMR